MGQKIEHPMVAERLRALADECSRLGLQMTAGLVDTAARVCVAELQVRRERAQRAERSPSADGPTREARNSLPWPARGE